MAVLHVRSRSGETRCIEAQIGASVMQNIRNSGLDDIVALCGGACSCATCHVYVDPEFIRELPALESSERDLLEAVQHRTEGSRLSCQLVFTEALDGLRITIAPE